jgi:hypothetical protein
MNRRGYSISSVRMVVTDSMIGIPDWVVVDDQLQIIRRALIAT